MNAKTIAWSAWVERVEAVRRGMLVTAARTPGLRAIVRSREQRIAARGFFAIATALVLAVVAPAATLAISPVVLGVPHVASALRYLVLRQRLDRSAVVATACACAVMAGLRVAEQYGHAPESFARLEVLFAFAWAMAAAVHGARISGAWRRLSLLVVVLAPFALLALTHARAARIAFVHVHNLGAVVLWAVFFRRRARIPKGLVVALVAAIALLLSGATLPVTRALGATASAGVDIAVVAAWLAPGVAAGVAVPLVLAHAFTDSVHYAFWLGVIPEETLRGQGTLSFRMTWRALVRDFGLSGLAVVAAAASFVAVDALVDAAGARGAYFAVAGFHGYVEGVTLVFFAMRAPTRSGGYGERSEPSSEAVAAEPFAS